MAGAGISRLRATGRSRQRPARRALKPLGPVTLTWGALVGWRWRGRGDALGPRARAALERRKNLEVLDADALQALIDARPVRPDQLLESDDGLAQIALVLEVVRRETGLVLRQNQVNCALHLLAGDCVELRTGEGKTLAAATAALIAGRCGVPVHVLTVNDYLAQRDYALLAPLAQRLSLRSAVVLQAQSDDEKRAAYDNDIVYGTNKTLVFDALRDQREKVTKAGRAVPRQMGQAFAIVDEADSVLIDDATVPMILSEPAEAPPDADVVLFTLLLDFAQACRDGEHRSRDAQGGWRLTEGGIALLSDISVDWPHPAARDDGLVSLAEVALTAQYGFVAGVHYIVRDGDEGSAIEMIDQATGRLMPDRKWAYGMQQMVEMKEGIAPSAENRTVGQVTQQSYFRQYRQLSGLTGTAHECRPELWAIYKLAVQPIAPHAPSRLVDMGLRVHRDRAAKFGFIAARAVEMAQTRAVLIGLNDVIESAALQQVFAAMGLNVAVLDALSEAQEADLVAVAGQLGCITIATHLAGRGTDIALDASVRASGGLHVMIGSAMASARLERQLYGRAGRAGDPGSYERHIAMDDRVLTEGMPFLRRALLRMLIGSGLQPARVLAWTQASRDRAALKVRRKTLLRDQELAGKLGQN